MPIAIVSTLGGEDSNSLLSLEAVDAYFSVSFESEEWEAIEEETRKKCLIQATRDFSALAFYGVPVTETQALYFPRYLRGVCDGTYLPRSVADAFCEHCLDVARAKADTKSATASAKRARLRADGVTSYRIGDLSETFSTASSTTDMSTAGKLAEFSPRVQRLLGDWVRFSYQTDSGRRPSGRGLWWPEALR